MAKQKKKEGEETTAPVNTQKVLSLPRYTLALFYQLLNVPLHGAQSRARNRIGQQVKDQVNYIEDERIKIIEGFAEKDDKGEPKRKMVGEEEMYDVTPENMVTYRKEFDEFMHENWVVEIGPSNKQDFALVRPIVLESKVQLETVDGYAYEEICKAFEAI